MTFRSEIRDSTINELIDKVRARSFEKYLVRLSLANVRAFRDQTVTFDFPVTALIGPNGGGKTTVLGAAGCAYQDIQPRLFFAKSGRYDDSMQDWRIEYELIDRSLNERDAIRRTASFRRARWNRDAPRRSVLSFGVARTVPANERVELRQCASNNFSVPMERVDELTTAVQDAARKILGKDLAGYEHLRVDDRGRVSLLTGADQAGVKYSEFHFGAGESSVIRMVMQIEDLPESALILVEEIENGLHPVATQRMVEYLIDVARRKRAQVVFTTHSDDALAPLPSEAIWAAYEGKVVQGKLDVTALRTIAGQVDTALAVFAEDEFSKAWTEMALRYAGIPLDAMTLHGLQGDGTAVRIHRNRRQDPTARFPSLCYIDGDSRQEDAADEEIYRLPGGNPERHVFDQVLERLDDAIGKLTVALQLPFDRQEKVAAVIREVANTNRDSHLIYSQVGEQLGLISEAVVRGAFLAMWAQLYPDEVEGIAGPARRYTGGVAAIPLAEPSKA